MYLDGMKLNQRGSFIYLGGAMCGLAFRIPKFAGGLQPGISFGIKVDGVMGDFTEHKGNMFNPHTRRA